MKNWPSVSVAIITLAAVGSCKKNPGSLVTALAPQQEAAKVREIPIGPIDSRSFQPTQIPEVFSLELSEQVNPGQVSEWISPPVVRESGQSFALASSFNDQRTQLHFFSRTGKLLSETIVPRRLDLVAGLSNGNLLFQSVRPFLSEVASIDRDRKVTTESLYRPLTQIAYEKTSWPLSEPVFSMIDDHAIMLDYSGSWHVVNSSGESANFNGLHAAEEPSLERLVRDSDGAFITFGALSEGSYTTSPKEWGISVSHLKRPTENCFVSYEEISHRLKLDPGFYAVPRWIRKTEDGKIAHFITFVQETSVDTARSDRLLVFSSGEEICSLALKWKSDLPIPHFNLANHSISYEIAPTPISEANGMFFVDAGDGEIRGARRIVLIDSKTLTLKRSYESQTEIFAVKAWSTNRIVVLTKDKSYVFNTAGDIIKKMNFQSVLPPAVLSDGSLVLIGGLGDSVHLDSELNARGFRLSSGTPDLRVSKVLNDGESFYPMILDGGVAVVGSSDYRMLFFIKGAEVIKTLNLESGLRYKPETLIDGSLLLLMKGRAWIVAPSYWRQ